MTRLVKCFLPTCEKISKIDTTDALGDAILTMITMLAKRLTTIYEDYEEKIIQSWPFPSADLLVCTRAVIDSRRTLGSADLTPSGSTLNIS